MASIALLYPNGVIVVIDDATLEQNPDLSELLGPDYVGIPLDTFADLDKAEEARRGYGDKLARKEIIIVNSF